MSVAQTKSVMPLISLRVSRRVRKRKLTITAIVEVEALMIRIILITVRNSLIRVSLKLSLASSTTV